MTSAARRWVLSALIVVVLACSLVASAVLSPGAPASVPAASLVIDGTAEVDTGGSTRRLVSGEHDVAIGDRVRILTGEAVLALPGEGSLELRGGSATAGPSRVEVRPEPLLLEGDALLVAGAQEQAAEAGGARLSLVDGAARLTRSTGATFAVYQGQASLSTAGRTLEGGLPALRQVVVADAGMLPLRPSLLRVSDPPGPWDRRFLGDAIDLDSVLERRSAGFTTLLQDDFVPDVFFFQSVLGGLLFEPGFDQSLLEGQDRPVGETLVGAAIALVGEEADFTTRWRRVFELRQEGAIWGIIALDQGAARSALLAVLDDAVARSPLLFGPPSDAPIFRPVLPPERSPRPPAPALAPPPDLAPRPPGATPPQPPPPPVPRPPALVPSQPDDDGVLDPVVDPLVDLFDGVLEGLGGLL